jgi:hypothetical protein
MDTQTRALTAVYRGMLRAFPAGFRAEFEAEMVAVFAARLEAATQEGAMAALALLLREAGGLAAGGLRARLYTRAERPVLLAAAGGEVVADGRSRWVTGLIYGFVLLALLVIGFIVGLSTGLLPFPAGGEGRTATHVAALADLDGDGDLDVVAGNDQHLGPVDDPIWWNDGQGNFDGPPQILEESVPGSYHVATGDFNGDGREDILFGRFGSGWLILNEGARQFSPGKEIRAHEMYIGPVDVAPGDLDGDGDLDAFIAVCCGTVAQGGPSNVHYPPRHRAFLNDGAGNLTAVLGSLGDLGTRSVALGDLDGDGDLDIYMGNSFSTRDADSTSSSNEPNTVWLNDGAGRFTDTGQRLGDLGTNAVALSDLDGDGDLDVFAAHRGPDDPWSGPAAVWLNDGAANFNDSGQRLGDELARFVFLEDVDGDGDLDALVEASRWRGSVRLWLNDGAGRFTSGGRVTYPSDCAAAPGDVDGDGDIDIVAACVEREARVWLNDGAGRLIRNDE